MFLACHAQLLCGYVAVVFDAAPVRQVIRLADALQEAQLLAAKCVNCRTQIKPRLCSKSSAGRCWHVLWPQRFLISEISVHPRNKDDAATRLAHSVHLTHEPQSAISAAVILDHDLCDPVTPWFPLHRCQAAWASQACARHFPATTRGQKSCLRRACSTHLLP